MKTCGKGRGGTTHRLTLQGKLYKGNTASSSLFALLSSQKVLLCEVRESGCLSSFWVDCKLVMFYMDYTYTSFNFQKTIILLYINGKIRDQHETHMESHLIMGRETFPFLLCAFAYDRLMNHYISIHDHLSTS